MNTFLQLPAERRRLAFQQVDESMGLQASKPSVSRRTSGSSGPSANFFTLPCIGEHLTFKGGTSLSKAWSIFHYPSVFPANAAGYVPPQVKIELGARSDDWPRMERSIQSYVLECFPAFDAEGLFPIRVLAAGFLLIIIATTMAWRIKSPGKCAATCEPGSDGVLEMEKAPMSPSFGRKMSFSIPIVLLVALIAFVAYIADRVYGVVAFRYGYLAFCVLSALAFGAAWRACFPKSAAAFALGVFAIFAANFLMPPPSERLLRSAMLKVSPGTDASAIADIVRQQYDGSPYAMPRIYADTAGRFDRVNVSLLSQKERNYTSVCFLIENGKVTRSYFWPD